MQSIDAFGLNTMKRSSDKNTLLQVSVGNLARSGDEGGQVAKGLAELHTQLKDLDPEHDRLCQEGLPRQIVQSAASYFLKFEKADEVIADIVVSLDKGGATLSNDNTTLELEQHDIRKLTKILKKEIQLGMLMDESIEAQIEAAKQRGEDPEKIRFIMEEILFPMRQRVMDLQQMLVVNQQGILAIRGRHPQQQGAHSRRGQSEDRHDLGIEDCRHGGERPIQSRDRAQENRAAQPNHHEPDRRHLADAEGPRRGHSHSKPWKRRSRSIP